MQTIIYYMYAETLFQSIYNHSIKCKFVFKNKRAKSSVETQQLYWKCLHRPPPPRAFVHRRKTVFVVVCWVGYIIWSSTKMVWYICLLTEHQTTRWSDWRKKTIISDWKITHSWNVPSIWSWAKAESVRTCFRFVVTTLWAVMYVHSWWFQRFSTDLVPSSYGRNRIRPG